MKYIYEHPSGVNFEIAYEVDPSGVFEFHSVHALDSNYRVVGPDLGAILSEVYVILKPGFGESFLSTIATEIQGE